MTGRARIAASSIFRTLSRTSLSLAVAGARRSHRAVARAHHRELGVVFAMPVASLLDSSPVSTASSRAAEEARFLALNVRPRALVDAVVPPGYGFAVIAPDGKVLFHSDDGLSLEENFFEEVSNAEGVRERMQLERAVTWSGDYHGAPHRIHLHPVSTLQGCPWKIMTFQDLSPALASVVDHQSGTFRLSLLNLALLLAASLAAWWYNRSRGRDIRDLMTAPLSPDPLRLCGLVALTAFAAAAIATTALPRAHQWADMLYLFFVVLPFAAVPVCTMPGAPGRNAAAVATPCWSASSSRSSWC